MLLSALDAYDSDQHLLDSVREEISEMVGQDMHHAFTETHDYAEALKLARRIDKVYQGTEYHPLARRFLAELPKRLDDFKTFTLPTPDEWKKLKAKLSREEQIDYLASRLRLVQIRPNFTDLERKPPVINPFSELFVDRRPLGKDNPEAEGMKLTLKDVPALSKHLKDDWITIHWDVPVCVPGVSSGWSASSTRDLVAEIIDSVADHHLCSSQLIREKDWDEMTPKEIDAVIERINKWAKARETMSETDSLWELYQEEIKGETSFRQVERRVKKLLSDKALSKERRAEVAEAMKRFYQRKDADDWEKGDILETFRDFEPKAGLKLAETSLKEQEELPPKGPKGLDWRLRCIAAQVVFSAGEKDKGRTLLGEVLATSELDGRFSDWEPAVRLLLKDGSKDSLAQAGRLFENKDLARVHSGGRAEVLRLYLAAGRTEPYRFYRKQLDDEKAAERTADEIAKEFAKDAPDVKKIVADHPKAADQIPHLKTWLDAKLAEKK